MRRLLRPWLRRVLARDPAEVARRAATFRIDTDDERARVDRLGRAFLGGYNAMLTEPGLEAAAARGRDVAPHERPFFFEGLAMGYPARTWLDGECRLERAERDLLALDPAFAYLYYVGLGFWYGFRHRRTPTRLAEIGRHLDPFLYPLCFDGFGFKLGFFDFPDGPRTVELLERAPRIHRPWLYQGFGRALFFVFRHDEAAFAATRDALPPARRDDLETGRALAWGFTGIDRPQRLEGLLEHAADGGRLGPRLLGLAWALTARELADPAYYAACMDRVAPARAQLLRRLPELCNRAREGADGYGDWQRRTTTAACTAYTEAAGSAPAARG